MPVSRPILIALIVAVVAAVGFYATRAGGDAAEVSAPVVEPAPAPSEQAERPAKSSPDAAVKATDRAARSRRARGVAAGVPVPVQRAVDARKTVVLFFYKPWSADDRATARGVAALRSRPGVAVFTDPIGRLAKYRGLVGELGVSQAPAVVIVGRNRMARVIEGFIDPATLAQDVADAR
jgi:hypothetical protein